MPTPLSTATPRRLLACALLAGAGFGAAPAQAVALAANGQWATFDVAFDYSGNLGWIDIAGGSALSFSFTIPTGQVGLLTVVDAGFAGDRFAVTRGAGIAIGTTSAAVNSYPDSIGLDYAAAIADGRYSRGVFTLAAGSYDVTGRLIASAVDNTGSALNSTVGGISLTLAAVPEPATLGLLLGGLGLVAVAGHRGVRR